MFNYLDIKQIDDAHISENEVQVDEAMRVLEQAKSCLGWVSCSAIPTREDHGIFLSLRSRDFFQVRNLRTSAKLVVFLFLFFGKSS